MRSLSLLLGLLLLVVPASSANDDSSSSSSSGSGYDGSSSDDGSYYNKFSVCSDSAIVVSDIVLVCDSPGAYYYGSNKYRNSATCQAGDKAKLTVKFQVSETLDSSAYIHLMVKGYGSVESKQIYAGDELCSTSGLSSSDGATCPSQGYYVLVKSFYWGENSDSYEEAFQPKVVIGFASDASRSNFDLGGANTNQCSGDTFMNWTTGVTKSATNTLRTFFATFGILFGAVLALGGAAFYLSRQANATPKQPIGAFDAEDLDEHDYHKIAMVGNNRNLVDF